MMASFEYKAATSAGEIEATDFSTLADALPGAELRIRAVRDEDPGRLRSMEAKGLTPGARITVSANQLENDAVAVRVGETPGVVHAVRADLARRIYVVPAET